MPAVNKKVLYLDQFAISQIFKTKSGKAIPRHHHAEFWAEATRLLDRAMMRQQIICPASNIHRDETIVHAIGQDLGLAHEMLGGDTSFVDTSTIERGQILDYLDAYLNNQTSPGLQFDVDDVLQGSRNVWLPDLHITVRSDWSAFVDDTKRVRDSTASESQTLYERWARERPTFDEVLSQELSAVASGYLGAYFEHMALLKKGLQSGDVREFMDGAFSPIVSLIHEINHVFVKRGVDEKAAFVETAKFFAWPELQTLPTNWISAHLFAAIADRLAKGQKRKPSRGMFNDIKAIAVYGPYADAMFLDNECVDLLEQKSVAKGVKLKARIFCLKRQDAFLQYLQEVGDAAPAEVVEASKELYGGAG